MKHLTNALYWSIRIQQQVRHVLLQLDPNAVLLPDAEMLPGDGMGNNPRVFYCAADE